MKCTQCSHDVPDGVKFCPECGAKQEQKCASCSASLAPGAKFCPECGTKVAEPKVGAGGTANKPSFSIDLAPNPLGLPECNVTIHDVSAEGPDSDGDLRITVKYEVANKSLEDWEYLEIRSQLLGSAGQVVDESTDTQEQLISAGEVAEFEAGFWGTKLQLLGEHPTDAHVVVNVLACGLKQENFGEIQIPDAPFELVPIPATKIGETVQLISGSMWKTAPDDDNECRVQLKAFVQNLSDRHIPQVKLIANVVDKVDREITDAGTYEELHPGNVCLINGSGYGKEKQFKGAKVKLSICAYIPLAVGSCVSQGMTVSAPEDTSDDGGSFDEEESDDSHSRSPATSQSGDRTFYVNMDWFSPAEQPKNFFALPEAFPEAEELWRDDAEGNMERIIELLSPYVGARFVPGNLSNWNEIFTDPSDGGEYEYEAVSVKVVGIDYSVEPIPLCKAEATIRVKVTGDFNTTDLDEWQDNNDRFTDAVSFYWNIERNDDTEELDFTYGDNQGVECIVMDDDVKCPMTIKDTRIVLDELTNVLESYADKYMSNGYLTEIVGAQSASGYSISFSVEVDENDNETYLIVTDIVSDEEKIEMNPDDLESLSDEFAEKFVDEIKAILSKNGYQIEGRTFLGVGKVDGLLWGRN